MYWFASLDHVLRHGDSTWHLGQTKGNSLDRVGCTSWSCQARVRVRIGLCMSGVISFRWFLDFSISRDLEFFWNAEGKLASIWRKRREKKGCFMMENKYIIDSHRTCLPLITTKQPRCFWNNMFAFRENRRFLLRTNRKTSLNWISPKGNWKILNSVRIGT